MQFRHEIFSDLFCMTNINGALAMFVVENRREKKHACTYDARGQEEWRVLCACIIVRRAGTGRQKLLTDANRLRIPFWLMTQPLPGILV